MWTFGRTKKFHLKLYRIEYGNEVISLRIIRSLVTRDGSNDFSYLVNMNVPYNSPI